MLDGFKLRCEINLESSDVDVVDGSCRELPVKLFSPESLQVVDEKFPQFEDVIPGELWSPLHYDGSGSEQLSLES